MFTNSAIINGGPTLPLNTHHSVQLETMDQNLSVQVRAMGARFFKCEYMGI